MTHADVLIQALADTQAIVTNLRAQLTAARERITELEATEADPASRPTPVAHLRGTDTAS